MEMFALVSRLLRCFSWPNRGAKAGSLLARVAVLFCVVSLSFMPQRASAQLNSNTSDVVLTATLLETLTVAVTPGAVSFALVAASSANGSTPVAITTTWALSPTRTTVDLYGSFSSATAALSDEAGHTLASSTLFGQVTTGLPSTFTAFTQTGPFGAAGASLHLFSQAITLTNVSGTRTDNLSLRINLSSVPQPSSAVYEGILHIHAQAL